MKNKTKFGIFWILLTIIMTVTVQILVGDAYGFVMGGFTYMWFYVGMIFGFALNCATDIIKD